MRHLIYGILLGTLCALSAGAEAPTKKLPLPGKVFPIGNHTAFLIAPETNTPGLPIPWVWYAPTLPNLPGAAETWMFEQFLSNGIAIAGIDVGESYGSPDGRAGFDALHKELTTTHNLAPRACLLARSRGGLMLYSWAAEHPDSVAGIAGIYPVCNIASYPGVARAAKAYKITPSELTAQLNKHNPIDRLAPLAKAKVPIFHIHGDVDKVVPLDTNSAIIKQRYTAMGGTMTLQVPPGQGHNMWPGFLRSQDLVDFVIEHATARAGTP